MKKRCGLSVAGVVLAGFHLVALLAGFFGTYSYDFQDRDRPYAPPSRIRFIDDEGKFHVRPFIYINRMETGSAAPGRQDHEVAPISFFAQGDEYEVAGVFHSRIHLLGVNGPARLYLLGTDGFGRDQWTRLLYGASVSLFSGLLAALLSVTLGLAIGGVAGFGGRGIDTTVMRAAEVFLAVPWFYLLLAVRAFLPLQMNPVVAMTMVVLVLGAVGWARPARLIRGAVLSLRERNFVLAAEGLGASPVYMLRRHVLPHTMAVALTQLTLLIPQFILAEVVLSFLGLGIGEPVPSWGNMIAASQHYHVLVSYWWMLIPVVAPVPVFFTYHLLSDRLQSRLQL